MPQPAPFERFAAGRPDSFPSVLTWLRVGVQRNLRGVLAALVAAWYYLPLAVFLAVFGAVVYGVIGFVLGLFAGPDLVESVEDVPMLGALAESLATRGSGIVTGLLGIVTGLVGGFVGGLLLPWAGVFQEDPLQGIGSVLGVAVAGLLIGLLYLVYRVVFERPILHLTGARRLSRREGEILLPILRDCADRLGLPNHPPLLIDDSAEPNAYAYTRHLVLTKGLLDEFNYDRDAIAGVLCHELVHWRNGDALSSAFIRGVALPLYLIHAAAGWLMAKFPSPFVRFLAWLVFWPILLTVRFFLMPAQAADLRSAEYRADAGAALAGHGPGLRRVLARFRRSFESGRNGWDRSVCATHPANELRLERLEQPGGHYPLPDPEGPATPLPVTVAGSLRQD